METKRRLGSYELVSELGTGGMGTVYLAHGPGGESVAVKVIHPHLLASSSFFQRFQREAEIGKLVQHPNVVRTIDIAVSGDDDGGSPAHYLVMEYVEGQTLRALLDELEQVPEELCRHIGREIAKALVTVHAAGVVHRDLKPENVLITKNHVVKVMDLGVARLVDEAIRLSQTGAFAGSVLYAAPEQFRGGDPDPRSDLYSLGLMLFELATGKHPSTGEDFAETMQRRLSEDPRPVSELNPQLSAFFEELLQVLLARDAADRFQTAAELVAALEGGEQSDWWRARAQSVQESRQRAPRQMLIPRETNLHGRDEELAQLRDAYFEARAGRGRVVLVEGEAGIGKTRLVDEAVRRLREEGEELHFLFGRYPPGAATTSAAAFAEAFGDHFGREGLARTLRPYLRQTPVLVPAFAALLRGEPAPDGQPPLEQDSIQTVFVHTARALAKERPTVLLIDDLQYAPEDGRALFSALSLVASEHRLLLVAAARPPLADDWIAGLERIGNFSHIALGRLGPKGLARVLIDAFRSERLAQELLLQISQKSDGNPFFVFEIIRGLRENNLIRRDESGSWVRTRVIEQITIPSSVLDLIQARISELDEKDKDLMDVAACCGFRFDPLLVAAALGMEQIPAMKRFARIEKKHRLIRSAGRTCTFDHQQIQEALYDGMPELLREPYHARLAEALERREREAGRDPAASGGALCLELCNHWFRGAQGARAKRYLEAALDHLQAHHLHDAALELADRALDARGVLNEAERVDVLLRKAGHLDLLGEREQEAHTAAEARRLADGLAEPALRARALLQEGRARIHDADYAVAQERLEVARELAREAGDAGLEAAAEAGLGNVCHDLGVYSSAHEHHERTLELARANGDVETEADAALNLAAVFAELGQRERARGFVDRALEISRETGNRRREAHARGGLGWLDLQAGDFAGARRHLDKCLMYSHEVGARRAVADAIGSLGMAFLAMGRLGEALQHYERHLALSREVGSRLGEATALHGLGMVRIALSDAGGASEALERSLAVSREIGVRRAEGFAVHALARWAELQKDRRRALRRYEEAHAILREIGNRRDEAEMLLDLARMRLAGGDRAPALDLLDEAGRIAGDLDYATVRLCGASLAAWADSSRLNDALKAFEECEERCEYMPRMRARFVLFRATRDRAHLERAYGMLAALRRFAPDEFRNPMISRVPWHREIVVAARDAGL